MFKLYINLILSVPFMKVFSIYSMYTYIHILVKLLLFLLCSQLFCPVAAGRTVASDFLALLKTSNHLLQIQSISQEMFGICFFITRIDASLMLLTRDTSICTKLNFQTVLILYFAHLNPITFPKIVSAPYKVVLFYEFYQSWF